MTDTPIIINDPLGSRDNEVRPFQIEGMDVRGRAVRLGTVVDQILSAHNYPDPVARILGEFLTLTALLGSIMKYNGIVTLQAKTGGPVPMVVADYEIKDGGVGHLRGYAQIDEIKYATYGKNPSFHGLIGSKSGYLALTIDQGADMERYQGIVEINGESLSDVARSYFMNSEQTPTEMSMICDRDAVTGNWRAGGLMVQHLSRGEEGQERLLDRETEEQWNRASVLMHSVKSEELLDAQLDLDQILYRLFNEDGVRVFDALHLDASCRCSREKLLGVLSQFGDSDINEMCVDGSITVDCQFCSRAYSFDPSELKR
jgi:molecular chaperone Hsp33